MVKGESSAGKSYTVSSVSQFFPREDVLEFTALTKKSLFHRKDSLSHKVLIVYERPGAEESDYAIRTLQSEKKLVFSITVKNPVTGEFEAKDIVVDGPVVFLGTCNEFTFDATSSFDPDNQALTYHWDFGDGNVSEEPVVTHRFEQGDDFNVILSVQDNSGLECDTAVSSQVVSVNTPPVASLTGPGKACTNQVVTFDASGTTDNTPGQITYNWDFGDGTTGSGEKVVHTYQTGGTYKAMLTVNDLEYTKCSTSADSIIVTVNSKPSAIFSGANIACTGEEVSFDASGTNDPDGDDLTYTWDFGDGTDAQGGTSVAHQYNAGGIYSVRLTVDDNKGTKCSKDMSVMNVSINTPPSAVLNGTKVACKEMKFHSIPQVQMTLMVTSCLIHGILETEILVREQKLLMFIPNQVHT